MAAFLPQLSLKPMAELSEMSDNFSWSMNAGRWVGVPVRIHLFLFLFIVFLFGFEWNIDGGANLATGTAMATAIVLLGSILIHELAHAFALSNLGGHVNNFVLVPWGGTSDFALPPGANSRAVIHFAGIFSNGMIVALCAGLLIQSGHGTFTELVNPFRPHRFDVVAWEVSFFKIVTWVNFQLMFINLLPCYPLDGSRIVRAMIDTTELDLPRVRIETAIKLIGNMVAFGFIGVAWICRDLQIDGPIQPIWLPMLLIGITLLFTAKYSLHVETNRANDDWQDFDEMDYGSIYSETSFFDFRDDSESSSAYSQWLTEKQEARREVDLRIEAEEEKLADGILDKLHKDGIKSLSEEEKLILHRVSERIRRRREEGVNR